VRLGLIGYGALGAEVGASLAALGEVDRLASVLVRPGRDAGGFAAASDVAGLLAAHPDVVLEAAGQGAVAEYGAAVLAAGVALVITSTGALADPTVAARLRDAEQGGGRLLIAPGAIAGLDGLIAARLAGLSSVTYTSLKPPHAWRGTAAEDSVDLDDSADELVIFEGSAREAALAFPKNANVAVSVGLCGVGLDRTRTRLVSSRRVSDPLGVIVAEGAFGTFRFEVFARAAPDNPKSSRLTAHSLLQCARLGFGIPALALLDDGPDIRMETHAVA
jgi:aspartate dehydrogenase